MQLIYKKIEICIFYNAKLIIKLATNIMGFWESVGNFVEKWDAAGEVVDATLDLDPTYKTSNDGEYFKQVIPDPVTEESAQRKIDRVNEANDKLDAIVDKQKK